MKPIEFDAPLQQSNGWNLLRLPKAASLKLPSRGMTMVKGRVNDHEFQAPLEPDGAGSHWLKVDPGMLKGADLRVGTIAKVYLLPIKEWPEPTLPDDLRNALDADKELPALWRDITPMARWDWIRWINGTGNAATRQRRVDVTCSKLLAGKRRPCCFNRAQCTEPAVSKNGVLVTD